MNDAQGEVNRMYRQMHAIRGVPCEYLDAMTRQLVADSLADERKRRGDRITLTIAWCVWGLMILAYVGFYLS